MNGEGYRDPVADEAVKSAMREMAQARTVREDCVYLLMPALAGKGHRERGRLLRGVVRYALSRGSLPVWSGREAAGAEGGAWFSRRHSLFMLRLCREVWVLEDEDSEWPDWMREEIRMARNMGKRVRSIGKRVAA